MPTSTSNAPKKPARHIGRSVYDGKRPLTPAQLVRTKKTIQQANDRDKNSKDR
jgi:hypothetical protein